MVIREETLSLREVAEDLMRQLESLDNIPQETRSNLSKVISGIDDPSLIPAVWEHGDFAPWNIKSTKSGDLHAVDWEFATRKGLPLFDLIYFRSIQSYLFGESELFPKSFWGFYAKYIGEMKMDLKIAKQLIPICLARDGLRCFESGEISRAGFLMKLLSALPGELP